MKTPFKIQKSVIPKGMKIVKEEVMPPIFYSDLFRLTRLDEVEGPFIWEKDHINVSAGVLDFLKENKASIPALEQINGNIYAMGTLYNKEDEEDTEENAWIQVRSIRFDTKEKVFVESDTRLFYQEFYSGHALLYNIKKHKAYEANEKTEEEMAKLNLNQGKVVRVLFTEPPERHALSKYWPDGFVGPLSIIDDWKGILSTSHHQFGSHNASLTFIGADMGITKITVEETGEILYENSELFYPQNMGWEKMLNHMNEMRELKYGTNKYNASEL